MSNVREFCKLADGRPVMEIHLQNCHGEYADVLTYGATFRTLCVLDKDGNIGDVVLGAADGENAADVRTAASVMGRCGNRIAFGKFTINGREYQLKLRNPAFSPHHLHGNEGNFSSQIFDYEASEDGHSVVLTHYDDGRDGWECGAQVKITYTLTDDHEFHIDYELTAEGDTLLTPTNHAYFNLNMPHNISSTVLHLNTDLYAPKSELGMPDGRLAPTPGTPLDFSVARSFDEGFASEATGDFEGWTSYDDFYFLPGEGYRKVAEAWCPENGRVMETYTDQTALIMFTPTRFPTMDNKGMTFGNRPAFCLETQYMPNAVNCEGYVKPIFHAGETMRARTTYKFSVK